MTDRTVTHHAVEAAAYYLQQNWQIAPRQNIKSPDTANVIAALLAAEKHSKQTKQRYDYAQLLGSWRLGFVSGTRKQSPRSGAKPIKALGKGQFLPRLIKIVITYSEVDSDDNDLGRIQNAASIGPIQLMLTGPTKFWPKTNSLGFDFTTLKASVERLTIYQGYIRGGKAREQAFGSQSLKDQAFFTFFQVEESYLAARGKGGGLALWIRDS